MFNIIEGYIKKMSKDDVNNFALKKDIHLSSNELDFTYDFIKKNYKDFFNNPNVLNLELYKNNYSQENFSKITKVYQEYLRKYTSLF